MLDDSDLDFVILGWPSGGWIITVLGLIIFVVVLFIVSGNKDECAKKHCANGATSQLLNHECLCVEKPVTP